LRALVEPTRAEEGCGQYDLHQDLANPLTFYMIERWSSDEALQAPTPVLIPDFPRQGRDFLEHFELKRLQASPESFFY
jgi:hypothetical protein